MQLCIPVAISLTFQDLNMHGFTPEIETPIKHTSTALSTSCLTRVLTHLLSFRQFKHCVKKLFELNRNKNELNFYKKYQIRTSFFEALNSNIQPTLR